MRRLKDCLKENKRVQTQQTAKRKLCRDWDEGGGGWYLSEKKKSAWFIQHETTSITLQEDGCSQGQMDNTCFTRADSEIASISECTDTAIKWTRVLGQLLRFRKRGGLDSASSLPSVQQGCTDNMLPWVLARAECLLGTSFPSPALCFAAAEPCCWPACSLP